MSLDDFFLRVDEKLETAKKNETLLKASIDKNLKTLKEAVTRVGPLAENYAARLQERGLKADIQKSDERHNTQLNLQKWQLSNYHSWWIFKREPHRNNCQTRR